MGKRLQGKSNLQIILIVTAAVLALAVGVHRLRTGSGEGEFEPKPLFKKLDLDKVAQVKITTAEDTVLMKRLAPGKWGLDSRGGFPVDEPRLKKMVLAMAELEASDRMTDNPEKYEKLGVQEEHPMNGRIELLDESGAKLADLRVGEQRTPPASEEAGFVPREGQYVRAGDDKWVYKVKDRIDVASVPTTWLQREILKLDEKVLKDVRIENSATTESVHLVRTGTDPFKLITPVPEGMKEKTWGLSSVTNLLTNLTLTDVIPATDPKASSIEYKATYLATQKNGVVYKVEAGELGEDRFLKLSASYDKAADLSLSDERTSDSLAAKEIEPAEGTVAAANERHSPWIYQVAAYQYGNASKKLSELIEEDKPPTPPASGFGAAGPQPPPFTMAPPAAPAPPVAEEAAPVEAMPEAAPADETAPTEATTPAEAMPEAAPEPESAAEPKVEPELPPAAEAPAPEAPAVEPPAAAEAPPAEAPAADAPASETP